MHALGKRAYLFIYLFVLRFGGASTSLQEDDPDEDEAHLHECVAAVVHAASTSIPPEIVLAALTPIIASCADDERASARCAAQTLTLAALDGCSGYVCFPTRRSHGPALALP